MLLAERNKAARDFIKFRALMTTPSVTGSFVMPANGRLAISDSAGGMLTVTINGTRKIKTPSLAPNQIYPIDWIERGRTVSSTSKIYILDEWNRPFAISNQDTFTAVTTFDLLSEPLVTGAALTRASIGWHFGVVNKIRNPTGTGAVPGTPGTPPTNWAPTGAGVFNGLSRSIVGTGVEDGIAYVDIGYAGSPTTSASITLIFESSTQIPALQGQTWVGSLFLRLMSGAISAGPPGTSDSYEQVMVERNAGGSAVNIQRWYRYPTNAPLRSQRFDFPLTLSDPNTAFVCHQATINYTIAVPVNFVIRIGLVSLASPSFISDAINVARFRTNPTTALIEGLLNESAATLSNTNSSGTGAVGTTALPTGWASAGSAASMTRTFTQVTEDGIAAVDIRIVGTPSIPAGTLGTLTTYFSTAISTVAAIDQIWIGSLFHRLSTGSIASDDATWLEYFVREGNSSGTNLPTLDMTRLYPTSAPLRTQRVDVTHKVSNPLAARITSYILLIYTGGVPVDFTIRVFPQLVQQPLPSSPIVSTNATVTRAKDTLVLSRLVSISGKVRIVRQAETVILPVTITDGTYTVPNDPSPIKNVSFNIATTAPTADTDIASWVGQVITNGGTITQGRIDLLSNLVVGWKADGIWALIDDLWMLVAENPQQALTSLKQKRLCVLGGIPVFTADRGYDFTNGTSQIDTGFIASTHAVVMTANSRHVSIYERSNVASANKAMGAGTSTLGQMTGVTPRSSAGYCEVFLGNDTSGTVPAIYPDSRGFTVGSRNGTLPSDIAAYRNGVAIEAYPQIGIVSALPTFKLFIGCSTSVAGAAQGRRPAIEGFASIGAAIPAALQPVFYSRLQTFMTTVGAQV